MPDLFDQLTAELRPEFYVDPLRFISSWQALSAGQPPLEPDAFETEPEHDQVREQLIRPGDLVIIGEHINRSNWNRSMDEFAGQLATVDDVQVGTTRARRRYGHVTLLGGGSAGDFVYHFESMKMLSAVRAAREAEQQSTTGLTVADFEPTGETDIQRESLIRVGDTVMLGVHYDSAGLPADDGGDIGDAWWEGSMDRLVGRRAIVLDTWRAGDGYLVASVECVCDGGDLEASLWGWRVANMRMISRVREERGAELRGGADG